MDTRGQNTVGPGSCTQRYPAYSCPHFILLSTLYPPASSQNVFRNQNYPRELQRGGGGALYKSHHECPIYILLARRCWWQHCDRGDRNSARLCSRRRLHTGPPPTAVRRFPILQSGLWIKLCMYCPGAMSLFTLLYVAPILGIIYYLFFWSRGRPTGGACVSALHNGYSSGGRVKMFHLSGFTKEEWRDLSRTFKHTSLK